MGVGCDPFLMARSLGPSGCGPSERSTPCSGGYAQVSGLASTKALLFLVVTGTANTLLPGYPAEDHGKHWVRRQGLGSSWHFWDP